jgi:RecA/RadA recombinase
LTVIQVIFGKKGSGKTKRILDMANASVKEAKGNVLFVDDDKSYTLSLKPQVRFVDASEYSVKGKDSFYGFLAGILAGNYDISVIYVDAFLKLVKAEAAELVDFFAKREALVANAGCDMIISFSEDAENVPESIRKYQI